MKLNLQNSLIKDYYCYDWNILLVNNIKIYEKYQENMPNIILNFIFEIDNQIYIICPLFHPR